MTTKVSIEVSRVTLEMTIDTIKKKLGDTTLAFMFAMVENKVRDFIAQCPPNYAFRLTLEGFKKEN